jgi:hypothetical protein
MGDGGRMSVPHPAFPFGQTLLWKCISTGVGKGVGERQSKKLEMYLLRVNHVDVYVYEHY